MNYNKWIKIVPEDITQDSLWSVEAYRSSLFSADIGWNDVTKLSKDSRTGRLSNQLYRALGSISANIAEGYSRGTGKDRARFYEYALGSARESRDWYFKSRHVLGSEISNHRIKLLTHIIKLLIVMVSDQRIYKVSEQSETSIADINNLISNVPLP